MLLLVHGPCWHSVCALQATYSAASSLTYFSLACELVCLALSCCGTIKTKATMLSRFAAAVCVIAAVCHIGAFVAVLNSGAFRTNDWLAGLRISEVNSRTIGLALAASIISAAFNLAASAVFVFAPIHWSRVSRAAAVCVYCVVMHVPSRVHCVADNEYSIGGRNTCRYS